jgi:hypothetical protein
VEILISILSMAIGAIITWLVSKHYYQKAGQELKIEATELKKLNTLMLRALENAGLTKFNRDKNGNITGMIIELSAKIEARSKTSVANLEIK